MHHQFHLKRGVYCLHKPSIVWACQGVAFGARGPFLFGERGASSQTLGDSSDSKGAWNWNICLNVLQAMLPPEFDLKSIWVVECKETRRISSSFEYNDGLVDEIDKIIDTFWGSTPSNTFGDSFSSFELQLAISILRRPTPGVHCYHEPTNRETQPNRRHGSAFANVPVRRISFEFEDVHAYIEMFCKDASRTDPNV